MIFVNVSNLSILLEGMDELSYSFVFWKKIRFLGNLAHLSQQKTTVFRGFLLLFMAIA